MAETSHGKPLSDFDRAIIGGSIYIDLHLGGDRRNLRHEVRRLREYVELIDEHLAREDVPERTRTHRS